MADPIILGERNQSIVRGQKTLAGIQTLRKKVQFLEEVEISADLIPLLALTDKMGRTKTVKDAVFAYTERDLNPTLVTVDIAGGIGDTTINLTAGHGKRLTPNLRLQNPRSTEEFYIQSVSLGTSPDGGDQITVIRQFGGTLPGTLLATDELHKLGMADIEGSDIQLGIEAEPRMKSGCVETFRKPFELSDRALKSDVYGKQEKDAIEEMSRKEMLIEIEKTFLFSTGLNMTSPYATMGARGYIASNNANLLGNGMDETTFTDRFIRPLFRRNDGQTNVVAFAGEFARKAIDGYALNNIRYKPDDDMIGINLGSYQSSFGTVKIVPHGLMTLAASGLSASSNSYSSFLMGINLDLIGKAVYSGRDMQLLANRQNPGVDGKKWEFLMDCGLVLYSELQHAMMTGIGF